MRIYLRPLSLIAGAPAERLLAAGQAVPLAGGRFAFGACQVLFRDGPRITGTVAPIREIAAWSDSMGEPVGGRIGALRERLCAPRWGTCGDGASPTGCGRTWAFGSGCSWGDWIVFTRR